jgi:hypothetical protein
MRAVETLGQEHFLVTPVGDGEILVTVDDPQFGRIASVRLGPEQAKSLIQALAAAWDRVDPPS